MSLPSPEDDEIMTAAEVMTMLRISSNLTLQRYIANEGLPAHPLSTRRGSPRRFLRTEVIDWLKSRCTSGAPGQDVA